MDARDVHAPLDTYLIILVPDGLVDMMLRLLISRIHFILQDDIQLLVRVLVLECLSQSSGIMIQSHQTYTNT